MAGVRLALAARATLLASLAVAAGCTKPAPPKGPAPAAVVDYDAEQLLRLAGAGDEFPFYEDASYDPAIAKPADCIGHPLGARPAPPDRLVACFQRWAEQSPRVQVARYAISHEGRPLIRAVISTPENLARLDQIKADLGRLADPRGLSAADEQRLARDTPAVGWFAYSIHGNEVSGSDASLAFGYHLIAGGDAVLPLLREAIVVIDPSMNPDGRQRTIDYTRAMRSHVPSDNYVGMERWQWPGGRGNHYLFDLNRDWIIGVHPETRGRWAAIFELHPQLLIDAHEMGSLDTYLFSPKNKPYNPGFPEAQMKWYRVFSDGIAAAFDRRGWAYYTREWSDGWYPGYGSTWGPINGAIGFLYEQSSTRGLDVRRPSGVRVSYRDTLRGHAVASLMNLATLVQHREAVLRDYVAAKRAAVARKDRAFVLVPGRNPDRERALIELLMRQKVEVYEATAGFTASEVETAVGQRRGKLAIPAGAYLVYEGQPQGGLVRALLAFDPRQDEDSLLRERRELEQNGRTTIYDLTAWNLGHAFALDAYWIATPAAKVRPLEAVPAPVVGLQPAGGAADARAAYAWIVDAGEDGSPVFAAHAIEQGLTVHLADEAFTSGDREFARGSVLVRVAENPADVAERVAKAADLAQVPVYATRTGRAPGDGIDLGGRHFHRLDRPRVALLANSPIASNSFGHVWHHLDRRLALSITILDVQGLGQQDLRRYNVIVIPDTWGSIAGTLATYKAALAAWIEQGGTLIAMGDAAGDVAKSDLGLSSVRLRREVLDQLVVYEAAAARSVAARDVRLDQRALWEGAAGAAVAEAAGRATREAVREAAVVARPTPPEPADGKPDAAKPKASGDAAKALAEQRDAWERRFGPRGAMLLGLVDPEAWMTAGLADEMPVLFRGDLALLAPDSVRVAVRLGAADRIRLSGLVWPEARTRLAHTAYATVERKGRGLIVLFAFEPVYRGLTRGTARLLSNAVIYGPSMGAGQPHPWHADDRAR